MMETKLFEKQNLENNKYIVSFYKCNAKLSFEKIICHNYSDNFKINYIYFISNSNIVFKNDINFLEYLNICEESIIDNVKVKIYNLKKLREFVEINMHLAKYTKIDIVVEFDGKFDKIEMKYNRYPSDSKFDIDKIKSFDQLIIKDIKYKNNDNIILHMSKIINDIIIKTDNIENINNITMYTISKIRKCDSIGCISFDEKLMSFDKEMMHLYGSIHNNNTLHLVIPNYIYYNHLNSNNNNLLINRYYNIKIEFNDKNEKNIQVGVYVKNNLYYHQDIMHQSNCYNYIYDNKYLDDVIEQHIID
jgi:hypothetical protein